MTEIRSLGYIGVTSERLEDWGSYATGLLGMQQVDRAGKVCAFRMDDRRQRLVVSGETRGDTLGFIGWEVDGPDELDQLAARLDDAGTAVRRASRALADERFVGDMAWFHDPEGNRMELFHSPHDASEPFRPGRSISGFKTGALGMGHVVLSTPNIDGLIPFYRDVLGFNVSDYGRNPVSLCFFHVNARHHSFAMVGAPKRGFHHIMVEYESLDDMGQGYDLALQEEGRVVQTLGRHTNDYMTSFYSRTPSGFFVESGFGGRLIDPLTWEPHETFGGPSLWGHERLYLDEEKRGMFLDMRLKLARDGVRAPNCPWMEETLCRAQSGP